MPRKKRETARSIPGHNLKTKSGLYGIGNYKFRRGSTDLSGIVSLDDLRVRATIIAFKDIVNLRFIAANRYCRSP
ncbi:MAG TPA: hypothetical protein VF681_12220 [Abditibacteriaceae bacterium]|jgi:hypothetical protein